MHSKCGGYFYRRLMIKPLIDNIKHELSCVNYHPILMCCSGGPDSVFLVHMVALASNTKHHIVYFNHHLRPTETPDEIELVHALGNTYGFTTHIVHLELNKKNQAHFRELRIKETISICKTHGLPAALTGHHLDDDVETMWMQFYKGATTNFRGIPKKTWVDSIAIVHPLLGISKKNIQDYLLENNHRHLTDSSNATTAYQRNRLRKALSHCSESLGGHHGDIVRTLNYLKQTEATLVNESKRLPIQFAFDAHWLKKAQLLEKTNAHLLLKMVLEHEFMQAVNANQEQKIKHGLEANHTTSVIFNDYKVMFDYKWVIIAPHDFGNQLSSPIQPIRCNATQPTAFGLFSATEFNVPFKSTPLRCCVTRRMVSALFVSSVKACPHPSKKKTYRAHCLSPIEQCIHPVIFTESQIIWVPNIYANPMAGELVVTLKKNHDL